MHDPLDPSAAGTAAFAAALVLRANELSTLTGRVQRESDERPRIDANVWNGPASWACELSLTLLGRELTAAADLLRSASAVVADAAWAAGSSA